MKAFLFFFFFGICLLGGFCWVCHQEVGGCLIKKLLGSSGFESTVAGFGTAGSVVFAIFIWDFICWSLHLSQEIYGSAFWKFQSDEEHDINKSFAAGVAAAASVNVAYLTRCYWLCNCGSGRYFTIESWNTKMKLSELATKRALARPFTTPNTQNYNSCNNNTTPTMPPTQNTFGMAAPGT